MTATAWELWRKDFRRRVREKLSAEGMRYRDLADECGYADASGVAYHLAGRGPSAEFIEKIVVLWPGDFDGEMGRYLAAKSNATAPAGIRDLHLRNILLALEAIKGACGELENAIADIAAEHHASEGGHPTDDSRTGGSRPGGDPKAPGGGGGPEDRHRRGHA